MNIFYKATQGDPTQGCYYTSNYHLKKTFQNKGYLTENVEEAELDTVVFNEKFDHEDNAELNVMKTRGWVNAGDFQSQKSYAPVSDLGLNK